MPPLLTAAVLVAALHQLRVDLRQLGSDLMVLPGPWERALPALAIQVGAQAVIAEEEVEHKWVCPGCTSSSCKRTTTAIEPCALTGAALAYPATARDPECTLIMGHSLGEGAGVQVGVQRPPPNTKGLLRSWLASLVVCVTKTRGFSQGTADCRCIICSARRSPQTYGYASYTVPGGMHHMQCQEVPTNIWVGPAEA